MVPPDPSGVTDYGHLLNQALRREGLTVDEHWSVNPATSFGGSARATVHHLARARAIPSDSATLWHYSSFAYGVRGIPLPGVLFGLLVRARGGTVITVVHEAVYPWGRRGWRGGLQAITQRIALFWVLLGSNAVVVTTSARAEAFRHLRWPHSRTVSYLPVFSTIGEPAEPAVLREHPVPPVIGVLSHSSEGARADLLFQVLERLRRLGPEQSSERDDGPDRPSWRHDDSIVPRVVLLGAPGPSSPGGRRWSDLARRRGMDRHLEFTGVVAEGELGSNLEACDLLVLLDPDGPTSRKTTLAAGLAHGMPIVALDGSDRWTDLVERGAVVVVPGEPGPFALALGDLLDSAERRRRLGLAARSFYRERMRLELIASEMARVIEETMQGRTAATSTAASGEHRP